MYRAAKSKQTLFSKRPTRFIDGFERNTVDEKK